jgi:heptosyltransferase-1
MTSAMDDLLIIRTSSLGDIIHTLPAYAALRKKYAEARITWVVAAKGKGILDYVPGIDEIVTVGSPGWRGRIRKRNQAAVDFQGLLKSGLIAWLSRSRRRFGFSRPNLKEPAAALFYNRRLGPVPESGHVILKNLKLLRLLGIDEERYEFPFVLPDALQKGVRTQIEPLIPKGRPAVFNVGAAWPTKRWASESWVAVLSALDKKDAPPLLLWGTPEEKAMAEDIGRATGVAIAPFLSISEILALIRSAAYVVSGDTFALQAACALDVPVVGLFGPTDPKRNGPFRSRDLVAYHEISCSRCYRRSCKTTDCLNLITPDEVLTLIARLRKNDA